MINCPKCGREWQSDMPGYPESEKMMDEKGYCITCVGCSMKSGDFVVVWKDGGDAFLTKTRSNEFNDTNGNGAIFVYGISGYYHSTHVRPLDINPAIKKQLIELLKGEIS